MTKFVIPGNLVLERDVISAALFNPLLVDMVCYETKASDYQFFPHMTLYSTLVHFNNINVIPTFDLVFKLLNERKDTSAINALLDLSNHHFSSEMLEFTIKELKEVSMQRALFNASNEGLNTFNGVSRTPKESSSAWVDGVRSIVCGYQQHKFRTIQEIIQQPNPDKPLSILQQIQQRQELYRSGKEVFTGYKTGYLDIDSFFDGFNDGNLTLIGARPAVGKTTFMINLALKQVFRNDIGVGIFSLEMPADKIAERLLFCHADVDWKEVQSGRLTSDKYRDIVVKSKELEKKTILIDDQARADLNLLFSRATHWKEQYGIKMIFIDYVQLIKASGKFNNKYEEVTHISQQLKVMAKELKMPIVSLAQLNRSPTKTGDKLPQVSELRDSGSLEQDADEIFLLHSPSAYDKYDKPGILQVFLKKNRLGPTGEVDLQVNGSTGKINNLTPMEHVKLFGQD